MLIMFSHTDRLGQNQRCVFLSSSSVSSTSRTTDLYSWLQVYRCTRCAITQPE